MLSLMYAGEMCHWYFELSTVLSQPSPPKECQKQSPSFEESQEQPTTASEKVKKQSTSSKESQEQQASASLSDNTSPSIQSSNQSSEEPRLWCVMELTQGVDFTRQWKDNFNPQKYGVEFLSKYVDVARGPLKDQSWNYVKAVQFLVSLKKSSVQ